MEELNVVLIKLANGENVICETCENCESFINEKFIEIYNPVLLNVLRIPKGSRLIESYMMLPWFGFSNADKCQVAVDKIITMVYVDGTVKENYIEYIENSKADSETSEELSVSFEDTPNDVNMEIEEFLENVIERIGEHIEEDEEYEGRDDYNNRGIRRSTRTLH